MAHLLNQKLNALYDVNKFNELEFGFVTTHVFCSVAGTYQVTDPYGTVVLMTLNAGFMYKIPAINIKTQAGGLIPANTIVVRS